MLALSRRHPSRLERRYLPVDAKARQVPVHHQNSSAREIKNLRVLLVPAGRRISHLRYGTGEGKLRRTMLRVLIFLVSLGTRAIRAMCRRRADRVIENLALRQQVAALKKERPRPPLDDADRAFWVALRQSWPGWASRLVIVNADTVARWNRDQFRRYWAKISRRRYPGRPRVEARFAGSSGPWLRMAGAHRVSTRSSRRSASSCPR